MNAEGPPVPIPNTEVKLCSAESTTLATAWEGRSWPTPHPDPKGCPRSEYFFTLHDSLLPPYGGVAQLGEHLPCKQGVMGSNPIISTSKIEDLAPLHSSLFTLHGMEGKKEDQVEQTNRIGS